MSGKAVGKAGGRPQTSNAAVVAIALFFLGLASIFSLLAPVHVMTLQRSGSAGVQATVTRHLLLMIPIGTMTMPGVTGVSRTTRTPDPGPIQERPASPVVPEQEGVLYLTREGGALEISTSPSQIEDVERRVREFLEGTDPSLRLRLVSNWKFGVLAVLLVALPGVLLLAATCWHMATTGFARRHA